MHGPSSASLAKARSAPSPRKRGEGSTRVGSGGYGEGLRLRFSGLRFRFNSLRQRHFADSKSAGSRMLPPLNRHGLDFRREDGAEPVIGPRFARTRWRPLPGHDGKAKPAHDGGADSSARKCGSCGAALSPASASKPRRARQARRPLSSARRVSSTLSWNRGRYSRAPFDCIRQRDGEIRQKEPWSAFSTALTTQKNVEEKLWFRRDLTKKKERFENACMMRTNRVHCPCSVLFGSQRPSFCTSSTRHARGSPLCRNQQQPSDSLKAIPWTRTRRSTPPFRRLSAISARAPSCV